MEEFVFCAPFVEVAELLTLPAVVLGAFCDPESEFVELLLPELEMDRVSLAVPPVLSFVDGPQPANKTVADIMNNAFFNILSILGYNFPLHTKGEPDPKRAQWVIPPVPLIFSTLLKIKGARYHWS